MENYSSRYRKRKILIGMIKMKNSKTVSLIVISSMLNPVTANAEWRKIPMDGGIKKVIHGL